MKPEINPIEDMMKLEKPQNIKEVEGTEVHLHYCFSCGQEFPVEQAEFCPICLWAKCPICGGCACTLTPEAKMAVRGVYLTFCQHCYNPCHKGRHHRSIPTKEDGTVDIEKFKERYPEAYKYYKDHGMDGSTPKKKKKK